MSASLEYESSGQEWLSETEAANMIETLYCWAQDALSINQRINADRPTCPPEELLALIRQGENSGVEFKRDDLRREQQAALFASSGLLHAERLPVFGSAPADLDRARLTEVRQYTASAPDFEATDDLLRLTPPATQTAGDRP